MAQGGREALGSLDRRFGTTAQKRSSIDPHGWRLRLVAAALLALGVIAAACGSKTTHKSPTMVAPGPDVGWDSLDLGHYVFGGEPGARPAPEIRFAL
jgi:hypothetical protein